MSHLSRIWIALIAVCVVSFGILLYLGSEIYQKAPPIPEKIISVEGEVLFTKEDIEAGQLVWRSMGGHQTGSIWGHGSLVAPDWNADWLHREALLMLESLAQQEYGAAYDSLDEASQAFLQKKLTQDMRRNSYDAATGVVTLSEIRADAVQDLTAYYARLFGADPEFQSLREQYALKENPVPDAGRRERLAAFFFWSTWATVTNRPGETISYTSNWPYEPLVENTPTPGVLGWSLFSIVLMIAGIGALAWYHASLKHEPLPQPSANDPLLSAKLTPSQRAVGKYFLTALGLFLLQIGLGGITAHYAVEGQDFYGIPLSELLPYTVTRTWHTQLAVFWIATAWLGTGLFIAPALSGHEPKFQKAGVNILWLALVVLVLGSMFGEWAAVQQIWDLDTSFWFGHQGYEFVDLGRFWQFVLLFGLMIWLTLVVRAIRPALWERHDHRPVVYVLFLSSIAIGLFYAAGLFMGKHTHIAIAEYWRWWVVHLWVEGFFETFATAVVALMFVRLGLIRAKSANSAVLFSTVIFLTGGILGTLHHLYWTGAPTSVIAWGASFSALEVVPLALIGFEAYESFRLRKASPWMSRYHWAVMFFVACAFWNLVGAGMFGFLINPPISLYYLQGLNTTPLHAHTAFMGVYGMLGIGLILYCTRQFADGRFWDDRLLKWSFWTLNGGLAMMALFSLLPVGVVQFTAALEHGYWYARSPEVIHSPLVETLVWMRLPGDVLFAFGGLFIVWFALKVMFRLKRSSEAVPVTETS
ncbi:nitric-oxide reductase large subunit [Luteithermobacter gelatinilyticus]|uniref:nitric-oxide reductase large subunit n=1 Tax=Luteithermobacter gelatinilyticus TaxID=2582913 RepID=UPI001105E299|nr:nitric-oxide reductase large subunit [Luteithermobacter gelatinilyticus]